MLLTKGFEVELYTGTPMGDVVGFAQSVTQNLTEFACEPDHRNVEYITLPLTNYDDLFWALLEPRLRLRKYLKSHGDYTLLPGSTLALGGSDRFERSDPTNPYHSYIEKNYGTKVVTASVHINIGIADTEALLKAYRVLRLEAPLFLALSASSPFLGGVATGWHSTRWGIFPQTPTHIPLFANHLEFVQWTEANLAQGTMQNVRHLWLSVRPNGDRRPYSLNRLELRITDFVSDPVILLAITALLELRIHSLLQDEASDPLQDSLFTPSELLDVAKANEKAAACSSLDALLIHWQTGQTLTVKEWIWTLYESSRVMASQLGIDSYLHPLIKLLEEGNEAQRWLANYHRSIPPRQIVTSAIQEFADRDLAYWRSLVFV